MRPLFQSAILTVAVIFFASGSFGGSQSLGIVPSEGECKTASDCSCGCAL